MPALTKQDYLDAHMVQSACNLSGVVFSFAQVMEKICQDTASGNSKRNTHPICRVYAEQMLYLSGGGCGSTASYQRASEAIRKRIEQFEAQERAAATTKA
jgi:hypothetical protein